MRGNGSMRCAHGLAEAIDGLAGSLARWGDGLKGTRRLTRSVGAQGSIICVIPPDAPAYRTKHPHQVTTARRDVDQFICIRRIRNDDLVAVHAERKRAEGLKAFERLARRRAGTYARMGARRERHPKHPVPKPLEAQRDPL